MWTFLIHLAVAEPFPIEMSTTESEPFIFTPSIVTIAESTTYLDESESRYRPKDRSNLTKGDAYNLGFDAARHNLEQRAEISRRILAYSLIKGTFHGIYLGATDFWGIYASILPHIILNNSVVFFPVEVVYDWRFNPDKQSKSLQKSYIRGYRQYYRLRKRAIIIPVEIATFMGGFSLGQAT